MKNTCFHCGETCPDDTIKSGNKFFCCVGCRTVYEIVNKNNLGYYYDIEKNPGTSPKEISHKFDFLSHPDIVKKLVDFDDGHLMVVSFSIPSIHCSSCIWILENLDRINPAIKASTVNFPQKRISITFATQATESTRKTTLKEVVLLLSRIGYEPYISLDNKQGVNQQPKTTLLIKVAVAGFAFGNIMFLSLPEYFQETEFWLDRFKPFFRWMMFGFSLPVVFYSGADYFRSAYKGLRSGMLNIDVPLALGIAVLFIRSTIDILFNIGTGYFDSLSGLVFFLTLGKFFQQKTFSYLSFERDYKAYFPIAVTRIQPLSNQKYKEEQVEVGQILAGDKILVKNNEILPVDGILRNGKGLIDYSFVTGEKDPIVRKKGDYLFAGGKQQAGNIEVEVTKPMNQSYLTQLWSHEVFDKNKRAARFKNLTNNISRYFTYVIIAIAAFSALIWLWIDISKVFFVFTAVLIVACPCALALAAPFTLGNTLRIFAKKQLYLKEAQIIEQTAQVDTVVFDKTGTLTSSNKTSISYRGIELDQKEKELLIGALSASNHPLSRLLYKSFSTRGVRFLDYFEEKIGSGIKGAYQGQHIRIGSYDFINKEQDTPLPLENPLKKCFTQTAVHISIDNIYKGYYAFEINYRPGIAALFHDLQRKGLQTIILSGDNAGEQEYLENALPKGVIFQFNQKPHDKLQYIKNLQKKGQRILMVGDGLNDAGALQQSDAGIVIAEDTNVFTPASDGILHSSSFSLLPKFIDFSKTAHNIIKWAFFMSIFYNVIGLGFAVTGHLKPVIAAILMPISSISTVAFTTLITQWKARSLDR